MRYLNEIIKFIANAIEIFLNGVIKFIANAIEIFLNGVIKFIATKANKYHFWWLLLIFLLLFIDPIRIRVIDILDGIPFWFPIAFFVTLYFSSNKFRDRIIDVIVNGTLIPIYEAIEPSIEKLAEAIARFIKRKREAESKESFEFSEPTENKNFDDVFKTQRLNIQKALEKIERGEEEEGLNDLQNLASDMPLEESASIWRFIGEIAYNNHTQKALDAYQILCNSEYFKTWDKIHLGRLFIRLDNIEEADGIFKEALISLPVNEKRNKMILLSSIGDICMMKQESQIALKNYQNAFEINQLLIQKEPENNEWQRDLAVTYGKIGVVYKTQENLDEAFKNYQEAFKIFEFLTQKEPENNEWQRDLAVSHDKIAGIHKLKNYFPEAIKNYKICLKILQSLSQANQRNKQYKIDTADILCELGETYKLQNKISKALGYLQKAHGIISPITKNTRIQGHKKILEKIETLLKELESEN